MVNKKALQGIRVLDFSWNIAGPTITRILGALGAEVIKVEWPTRPDPGRNFLYKAGQEKKTLNSAAVYNWQNIGKRSLTINTRDPEGIELIKRLIAECDIVVEAFSAKVFEKWGLSYETLQGIKPDIIYLSECGFGHSGRYTDMVTYGPTAQAFNGLTFLSGLPGKEPAGWGWSYMDTMAGQQGAIAALAALRHRNRTGEGQHIDMSQIESGIVLQGASILDYTVNGRRTRRPGFPTGNRAVSPVNRVNGYRGEIGAPYNSYPCKGGGKDDYCVISVLNGEQWKRFKKALGNPKWAEEAKYKTVKSRIDAQDELDEHIAQWTLQHDKFEVMELLQHHGVPSGAVQTTEERMDHDPQLKHRQLYKQTEYPEIGTHRYEGMPFRMSATNPKFEERFPVLGQDNEYVLGQLLGLTDTEIQDLEVRGITWPKNTPKEITVESSAW